MDFELFELYDAVGPDDFSNGEDFFSSDLGDDNNLVDPFEDFQDAYAEENDDMLENFEADEDVALAFGDVAVGPGFQPEDAAPFSNDLLEEPFAIEEAGCFIDGEDGPTFNFTDDFWNFIPDGPDDLVTANDFSADGTIDLKNNLIVQGNAARDLQFVQQQTGSTCLLMAQEQLIHRYTGEATPEFLLELAAEQSGIYTPGENGGSAFSARLLEELKIPHETSFGRDIDDLSKAIVENKDVVINVNTRGFYEDPTFAPESGHAVTVVAQGFDPETQELKGFYVTDSNFSQRAHLITVEKMKTVWRGDMIAVPEAEKSIA